MEKDKILEFLSNFKIGDFRCSIRGNDSEYWIDVDGFINDEIFDVLHVINKYQFVERFYYTYKNHYYWPPMLKNDDIEKLLKLVWELQVKWNIEKKHPYTDFPIILNVCGASYQFTQHCEFYTFDMQEIWPEIKNYILKNCKFPEIEIKSLLEYSTPLKKGHTQITINKGKKKFKIPTKI